VIVSPTRFCTNKTIKRIIEEYCPKNNAAVLDVGCGKGYYHQYFITYQGSYLGIDIKSHQSWQTKEEEGLHISFLVHDAEKLTELQQKYEEGFNFIIAIQSFEHIKNDMEAIKGMKLCLKEEGYILLTVPSRYSFFLYGFHGERRYTIPRVKQLADENGLQICETVALGGLATFVLHFLSWTIPAIMTAIMKIKIWNFYKKHQFMVNLITKLETHAMSVDKYIRLLPGGYAVVMRKGDLKRD